VSRPRVLPVLVAAIVILALGGVAGIWYSAGTVHHLAYQQEFCFGEWCVSPASYTPGPEAVMVGVHVRSDAKSATQRPDHPQAWLVAQSGNRVGGPQPALGRSVGPGESFDTVLGFPTPRSAACPRLLMSEGAWPPFLGVGYAPSPFTEWVDWPLCSPGLE
jgi:hypothetical protein